MSFEQYIEQFREREEFKDNARRFFEMARSMDTKPREICPYLEICHNTEEAIEHGFSNTTLGMNPSIHCMNGSSSYSSCPSFKHHEKMLVSIITEIDSERRKLLARQSKEGRE